MLDYQKVTALERESAAKLTSVPEVVPVEVPVVLRAKLQALETELESASTIEEIQEIEKQIRKLRE